MQWKGVRMLPQKRVLRSLFVLVLFVGMLFLPSLDMRFQSGQSVNAENERQVAFTPHVTSMNIMGTWETPSISHLETQVPGDVQLQDTHPPDEEPLPKILIIDGHVFHVGEMFYDAEGLRIAGITQDVFGKYGYATLMDHPEFRLLWHRDNINQTSYIIVHANDYLYDGDNGFLQHFENYQAGLRHRRNSFAAGLTGAGAIAGVGFVACLPSAGTTCILAGVGGIGSLLGGVAGEAFYHFTEVKPSEAGMISMMETIDINR